MEAGVSEAIPNLVLVAFLVYYLFIRRGVFAVLVAIFVYITLHGGYAVFAAAADNGVKTMDILHYQASSFVVKLIGALFLAYCFCLLIYRLRCVDELLRRNLYFVIAVTSCLVMFSVLMASGLIGRFAMNSSEMIVFSKESFFSVSMWCLSIIFAVAIKQGEGREPQDLKELVIFIVAVSALMTAAGVFEVVSKVAWAGTAYSYGYARRASATLFNPNVLGFWCALILFFVAFLFHSRWISRVSVFLLTAIFMLLLFLSSSRSGFVLSLFCLFAATVFVSATIKNHRTSLTNVFWPLFCFSFVFSFFSVALECSTPSEFDFVNNLYANQQRLFRFPMELFDIAMRTVEASSVESNLPSTVNVFRQAEDLQEESRMRESISGRLHVGYSSDNSFASIYAIGGGLALAVWMLLWLVLLWLGVKKIRKAPSIYSSYALSGVIFCFVSGFFLRSSQLFPVWIFLSMLLGACLCWFLSFGCDDALVDSDLIDVKWSRGKTVRMNNFSVF